MKRIYTILLAILLTASVFAQAPQKMTYQAVVRDDNSILITSTQVGIEINIYQGSATGTLVYTETQTLTTNVNGLLSIEIGGQTGFDLIDWANGPYFLETNIDPDNSGTYTITGVSQLLTVPYALHAKTAETITGTITETDPVFGISVAGGITGTDTTNWNNKLDSYTETDPAYTNSEAANITATDITNLSNLSGTNTGDQDGSETKVTAGTNVTVTGAGTTASPYIVNATVTGGGFTHYIGELYGGGIVVAIWKESGVEKGLVASLVDVSTSAQWSSITSTSIGVTAQSPTDGQANTSAIVAQGDVSGAAYLCDNYSSGGFTDWYLPAAWELNQCYNAAFIVNTILGDTNGFQLAYYWSSTEYNGSSARYHYFSSGTSSYSSKVTTYRVRAVRRF